MASRLRNADVTLGSRSRLVVVGALVTLWWFADTHIREDDTLPIGTDQINELVGVENFCDLMPADWLQVIDANNVKLIDYTAHNGTTAKKRALGQKRQQRHRDNDNADVTPASRSRNTNSVTRPREDLEKNKREERERTRAEVPRGTVIDAGSRLTAGEAFASLLEDWRRDVPECNPDAFAKWIIHVELSGRPMTASMRLAQARRLAGNGDFEAQASVVTYCAENGYKSLIPIADVRHRTQGRVDSQGEAPKLTWRPPPDEEPTRASG